MDVHETIRAIFHIESARSSPRLGSRVRDVGIAGELAQDAMVSALEQWPEEGIRDRHGGVSLAWRRA